MLRVGPNFTKKSRRMWRRSRHSVLEGSGSVTPAEGDRVRGNERDGGPPAGNTGLCKFLSLPHRIPAGGGLAAAATGVGVGRKTREGSETEKADSWKKTKQNKTLFL